MPNDRDPLSDEQLESMARELDERARQLGDESDRAAVLVALCGLDNDLDSLLRAFFRDDKKVANRLLGHPVTGGDTPLSTFSSRIDVAYMLELIGPDTRHDLHILSDIRNRFAHRVAVECFHFREVRDRMMSLRLIKPGGTEREDLRSAFTRLVGFLTAWVQTSTYRLLAGTWEPRLGNDPAPLGPDDPGRKPPPFLTSLQEMRETIRRKKKGMADE